MSFNIPKHTILLTIAGSRAYGIHRPESDVDIKGVIIPPVEYLYGTKRFEQFDKPETIKNAYFDMLNDVERQVSRDIKLEGSAYDLRKFVSLAAENNPNILESLFCRDEEVRFITPLGQKLRDNRDLFLSKKVRYSLAGYAFAQLQRIKTHREWLLNPPKVEPTRELFGLPTVHKTFQREHLNALLTLTKPVLESLGLSREGIDLIFKERAYEDARRHWEQFKNWQKNRNPARADIEAKYGYDTKHGGHLYRLLSMGKEALLTGKINVWRGDIDAEQILAIRAGMWSYDQLIEWATNIEAELDGLYKSCTCLPHSPDREGIDKLCVELHQEFHQTKE